MAPNEFSTNGNGAAAVADLYKVSFRVGSRKLIVSHLNLVQKQS